MLNSGIYPGAFFINSDFGVVSLAIYYQYIYVFVCVYCICLCQKCVLLLQCCSPLTGREEKSLEVRSIAFTTDGNQLLSSGGDGQIYHWDLRTRTCFHKGVDEGCLIGCGLVCFIICLQFLFKFSSFNTTRVVGSWSWIVVGWKLVMLDAGRRCVILLCC
ncbi:hypothetical protein Dimus_007777 [Dionaea muscipula]